MFDVRKTLFISSLHLAAVLRSDEALEKTFTGLLLYFKLARVDVGKVSKKGKNIKVIIT